MPRLVFLRPLGLRLHGFDYVDLARGSVPVKAGDHRKRRSKPISAEKSQRDYALAA